MTSPPLAEFGFNESAGLVVPGSVVIYLTGENLTGASGYGPFPTSGGQYLRVYLEGPNAAVRTRVTLQWFADEEMTQSLGADVAISPQNANTARQSFPVRGSWVRIVVEASAYPNVVSIHAFLTLNATSDNTGSNGTNHLIAVDNLNVGAGATSTQDATSTRGGPGFWNAGFDGAAAAGLIRLYMVSMAGGTTLLDFMQPDMATNGGGRAIVIPAMPLRIVAFNGGAAARNLFAVVSYRLPPL